MSDVSKTDLLIKLSSLFSKRFTLEELAVLAASAGLEYENVVGQTLDLKAVNLLQMAFRHNKLEALMSAARKARPAAPWPVSAGDLPNCPYKGLFAFQEEDEPLFFGRELFSEHLAARVEQQELTAVVGPSCSGKSSVVFASLIPKLRRQQTWRIIKMRPGNNPYQSLASTLLPFYKLKQDDIDRLIQSKKLTTAFMDGTLTL